MERWKGDRGKGQKDISKNAIQPVILELDLQIT